MRLKDRMSAEAYAEFRRKEDARHKRWRDNNPEKYRALLKRRDAKPANVVRKNARRRQLIKENPEAKRNRYSTQAKWRARNPDSVRMYKIRWVGKNYDYVRECSRVQRVKVRRKRRIVLARSKMLAAGARFAQDMGGATHG